MPCYLMFERLTYTGEVRSRGKIKWRDHKYHKGSSDELLSVCIESKWIENKVITVFMFRLNDIDFDTLMKIPFK